MNRRDFLKTSLATTILGSQTSGAQSLINPSSVGDAILRLNPYIQPKERREKRVYDNSQPKLVVWKEVKKIYAADDPLAYGLPKDENGNRYVKVVEGFVEGVSTPEKLLNIGGILIRRDYQSTPKQGFYLYFSTSLLWLSLPRRKENDSKIIEDRYAFVDSAETVEGIEKGFISMDYREFKLVEGSTIRKPTHMVYRPLNSQGAYEDVAPSLIPPVVETTPGRYLNRANMWVENVLFFDIPYRPLTFKLEIPPMIIGGVEVPMPTCFFEPYDEDKNKWVNG